MLEQVSLKTLGKSQTVGYASKKSQTAGNFANALLAEKDISEKQTSSPAKNLVMRFETSDGKKGELYWGEDMLASVGGAGGTVHVKYHESSTQEDPVAVIWGTDSEGRMYEEIIHLNEVNPNHGAIPEMIALNAHLSKQGEKKETNPIASWAAIGTFGVSSKVDYEKYYREYLAMQYIRAGEDARTYN